MIVDKVDRLGTLFGPVTEDNLNTSRTSVLSTESEVLLPISPEMNKMMNAQPNDTSCELSGFLDVGNESS